MLWVCNLVLSNWAYIGSGNFKVIYKLAQIKIPGNEDFKGFDEIKDFIGCEGDYNKKWCTRIDQVKIAAIWMIGLNFISFFMSIVWIFLDIYKTGKRIRRKCVITVGVICKIAAFIAWVVNSRVVFSDQCEYLVIGEKIASGCAQIGVVFEIFLTFLYFFGALVGTNL